MGARLLSLMKRRRFGRRQTKGYIMADNDRIEGSMKQAEGKLKEGAGKMTGDQKLEAEGKAKQAEGKVQNAVGGMKDSLKD
ncbi:MAG: hypothetical protein ACI8U3_002221 [Brevundimonas sp.]|jgi:uncharacterized protein YjbJ (UPF0337 family)